MLFGVERVSDELAGMILEVAGDPAWAQRVINRCRDDPVIAWDAMPAHLRAILADTHTGTWFSVAGTQGVAVSRLGARPGDPFGDLMYNILAACIRGEIRQRAAAKDLILPVVWCETCPGRCACGAANQTSIF